MPRNILIHPLLPMFLPLLLFSLFFLRLKINFNLLVNCRFQIYSLINLGSRFLHHHLNREGFASKSVSKPLSLPSAQRDPK